MKETFDRHAHRLTTAERREIWWTISNPRAGEARSKLRWALSTAAAVIAAGAIAFVVAHREPGTPPRAGLAGPGERSSAVERTSADQHRVGPGAERDRVVRPGSPAERNEPSPSLANVGQPPTRREGARRPAPTVSAARRGDAALALAESLAQAAAMPKADQHRGASPVPAAATPGDTGTVAGVITDAQNKPVPFASVAIRALKRGTTCDENGRFVLTGVPAGTASLEVSMLGFERKTLAVEARAGAIVTVNVALGEPRIAKMLEEIEVHAERRVVTMSSATRQGITAEKLRELPVDNLRDVVATRAGVTAPGDELRFRGGRTGETRFTVNGVLPPSTGRVPPPVIPTTGGTTLPNDEVYDSMFFRTYGANPFIATDEDSLSTFAVDVDAASYTVTRRYIELGHLPPADAVRVEEFVNFFPQGYPRFENDDFRILVDGAPSPFGRGYQLLRIGIKGREVGERDRKPAQLTFVIDVSGSMEREDRLGLVKQALRLLVDQLRDNDRVGIVVYGSSGRVLLEPVALGKSAAVVGGVRRHSDARGEDEGPGRQRILDAIDRLRPEGCTNAEEGLLLGYEMARGGYRPEAINRIVLCSDGVANTGRTGPESILQRTRTEADRGIHLSAIGFGMGNYNDVLMEQLADQGDGNYYYVDDLDEARRVFVENLTGTLQTIAKDAKVQVEFDPSRVLRYRLLGFENRDVADRDFRNDKVDAGEIGAGHEVTALYEVKLAPRAERGPIATVRLRYARPEHDGRGAPAVREIASSFSSTQLSPSFEDASPHFRLDAAVAEFAEILRGSYWAKEGRLSDVLSVARSAARDLRGDAATEFVSLVEKAARLSRSLKPEERRQGR